MPDLERCVCGHEESDGRGDVLRCPVHGPGGGVPDSAREAAVRIVDARHGYTVEHSPDPELHRREYERQERRQMLLALLPREDLLSSHDHPWTTDVLRDAYERLITGGM